MAQIPKFPRRQILSFCFPNDTLEMNSRKRGWKDTHINNYGNKMDLTECDKDGKGKAELGL